MNSSIEIEGWSYLAAVTVKSYQEPELEATAATTIAAPFYLKKNYSY